MASGKYNNLILCLEASLPRDNDMTISMGTEYSRYLTNELSAAIRGGYLSGPDNELGGLFGVSAGMGVSWRQFIFDFAWVPYGELGNTFRYALGVKF
jgi:hypothetical protein